MSCLHPYSTPLPSLLPSPLNPNRAEIFSHLIHAGGGVIYDPPPLTPVIAVIKGQTKKEMIKFCKKTNFEQFLTVVIVI